MTSNPKVIDPPDFDQQKVWDGCKQWVDRYDDPNSIGAAAGSDPGICSCPACGEYYWHMGRIQECVECGFQYPTDAWPAYSRGVSDGRRVAAGGEMSGGMKRRLTQHAYYAHGFHNPPKEDAFEAMDKVDWRSIAPVAPQPIGSRIVDGYCERCGKDKPEGERNRSGLCRTCKTKAECRHRTSMLEDCCKAGVSLRQDLEPGYRLPCYYMEGSKTVECPKFEPLTIEDVEARDAEIEAAMARMMTAGTVSKKVKDDHKGEDWSGVEPCPVCDANLHLTHAKYNGHVHGRCETEGCLSWME